MYHNVPYEKMITMATFNMEGKALEWLLWADRNNQISSWSYFVDEIIKRFETSSYEIPTERLSKQGQTGTVKEYQHKFEALANKVTDVNPTVLKEMFMEGLNTEIQIDVIKSRLESLTEAFALAQLYEKKDLGSDGERYC